MFNLLDPIKAAISEYKNLSSLRGSMSKLDNPVFSFDYTYIFRSDINQTKSQESLTV